MKKYSGGRRARAGEGGVPGRSVREPRGRGGRGGRGAGRAPGLLGQLWRAGPVDAAPTRWGPRGPQAVRPSTDLAPPFAPVPGAGESWRPSALTPARLAPASDVGPGSRSPGASAARRASPRLALRAPAPPPESLTLQEPRAGRFGPRVRVRACVRVGGRLSGRLSWVQPPAWRSGPQSFSGKFLCAAEHRKVAHGTTPRGPELAPRFICWISGCRPPAGRFSRSDVTQAQGAWPAALRALCV